MKRQTAELVARMTKLGLSVPEILTLRRAEMTLSRWHELECGTGDERTTRSIERDEVSGKPFMRVQYQSATGWKDLRHAVADREAGANRRIAAIMANHPKLISYIQGDCRGCSLYLLRAGVDIKAGEDIDSIYSRGLAVCD